MPLKLGNAPGLHRIRRPGAHQIDRQMRRFGRRQPARVILWLDDQIHTAVMAMSDDVPIYGLDLPTAIYLSVGLDGLGESS